MELLSDIELVLARTPQEEWTPLVRGYATGRLHQLLAALEPYVDGTMGPVSSKHVSNYVAALNLLGRLHRCFDVTMPQEQDQDLQLESRRSQLRGMVAEQVLALEQRAG